MFCVNTFFFGNFKDHHCFCKEHLERRRKTRRSNSNKKQLILENRKTVYRGNTNIVLDECEMLDEEHAGREHKKKEKVPARHY